MLDQEVRRWTASDAAELYDVARWGKGYFSIDENGHVRVHPTKDPERSIDLKQLVDRLQLRGIDLPILIRFADILKHRLGEIHDALSAGDRTSTSTTATTSASTRSRSTSSGRWSKRCCDFGRPYHFGLEAGSKPELLAVVAHGLERHADHLQRLQGRRVHRDGDAGPEDRPRRSFRSSRNTPSWG